VVLKLCFHGWVGRIFAVTLAVLVPICVPSPAQSEPSAPVITVDRLHSALLDVMKNAQTLGFEGRREKLAPVIGESLDLAFICRIVLGRHWDGLSQQERSRMIDTFTRLTITTYAARFDGFSGESFRTVEEKAMNRGRTLVRTELTRPADEAIHLDYVLHQAQDRWRIINIVAEGVSDLSLKRADYGSVFKREGFERLMQKLEGQIEDLENGA
jgi:phospholipid transport system substrate-binding protein